MDNRNFLIAIVVSAAILFGFQYLMPKPAPTPPAPAQATAATAPATPAAMPTTATAAASPAVGTEAAPAQAAASLSRDEVLKQTPRIQIDTPLVKGSISLKGGRLDDLTLAKFHETIDPHSPAIVLLSPSGAPDAYFSEEGWVAVTPGTKVPDADTEWTADRQVLTSAAPVTLSWDDGAGLVFTRTISIDDNYMFTVKQGVTNKGDAAVSVRPYALVTRTGVPPVSSTWISYEGPIGAFNGVEEDVKYTAIADGQPVERQSTGGWLGFSDKYWLGSVAPADQKEAVTATFRHSGTGAGQKYQADYLGTALNVAPGASASAATLVFAGPKVVKLLAHYRDSLGLPRFDNAVDFGWFWFFTKPIFYVLDWVYALVGNFGIAILILTVLIKGLFFPLQTRAVININKMKALQPEMVKLREKFGDDKVRLNQETMALYKKVGANPLAGCLPILLQIPVFFSLYKVLYVTIEMRQAPFYGWIHDLSAPDPTNIFTALGLIPWHPPHLMMIGIWPVIYCITMYLQQRMQPKPPDPVQAKMFQYMPIFFTFMLGNFPAGLVIYWSWNNTLTMAQQYVITKHMAVPKPARA